MRQLSPPDDNSPTPFVRRLDRVFGEMNPLLVAVAIGLAVLDFTFFVTLRAVDAIDGTQVQVSAQTIDPAAPRPPLSPAILGR